MNILLGRFHVDKDRWKQMIQDHRIAHLDAGMRFKQVWTNMDDPKEIFFMFELDDVAKAKAFLEKAGALDKEKQKNGEVPELTFLEVI